MKPTMLASDDLVVRYSELFVNRRAYTIQKAASGLETRACYYYRAKVQASLTCDILRDHLEGRITIGLYAISPENQRCKWVAIDADYDHALNDLLKLQWELRQNGVEAALERSRRGGHLWIFAEEPLLARDCRAYIHHIAAELRVPVKGLPDGSQTASNRQLLVDGIEIFPKQDQLGPGEFGNAMRGPLGVHRSTGKRYWFYGADYTLEDQIAYLGRLKRISAADISAFTSDLHASGRMAPPWPRRPRQFSVAFGSAPFSILHHLTGRKRKSGRNYFTKCPSCAQQGRDRNGDNLAISITDPRKYRCWAGCTKEMIRSAVGHPIAARRGEP